MHIAQQMPLPPTISCSGKSRLVLTFLVLPFCSPGWSRTYYRRAVKRLCVSRGGQIKQYQCRYPPELTISKRLERTSIMAASVEWLARYAERSVGSKLQLLKCSGCTINYLSSYELETCPYESSLSVVKQGEMHAGLKTLGTKLATKGVMMLAMSINKLIRSGSSAQQLSNTEQQQ